MEKTPLKSRLEDITQRGGARWRVEIDSESIQPLEEELKADRSDPGSGGQGATTPGSWRATSARYEEDFKALKVEAVQRRRLYDSIKST